MGLDHQLPQSSGQTDQHCALRMGRTLAHFLFLFQNDDPAPPVMRRHSSSDISKQKFGTMPLVPIRGDESNSSMLSANQTLVSRRYGSDNSFRARVESILHALTCWPSALSPNCEKDGNNLHPPGHNPKVAFLILTYFIIIYFSAFTQW